MKTVTTPKGTVLPLIQLKGKDYLMVGHRLQWFNEIEKNFRITTEFLSVTDEQTVARALVQVFNEKGEIVKTATATKRETKKDFSDHTEKAETSAIGRALAMLGYGTQFALSDLDEGDRLADSPVVSVKKESTVPSSKEAEQKVAAVTSIEDAPKPKRTSFRKPAQIEAAKTGTVSGADSGWE